MASLPEVVLAAGILTLIWYVIVTAHIVNRFVRRAIVAGTLEGYRRDVVERCLEDGYSAVITIPVAFVAWVGLLVGFPLAARHRRRVLAVGPFVHRP